MDGEQLLSQIECDVRAEVIAANFLENAGYAIEKISINNKGSRERKYRKDILNVETRLTRLGYEELLNIDVSRSGMYDLLPEGFFHGKSKKKKKTTSETIEEFKKTREEEEAARLFFHPIERELNRLRVLIEMSERETIFGLSESSQNDLFFDLFPELNDIEEKHQQAIIQVLPVVSKIRGNVELITLLCEFLFNFPAKAKSVKQFTLVRNSFGSNNLGGIYLGQNMVIGNYFPDYSPEFEVEIGPMNKGDAIKFLPGGEFDKILVFIRKFLIPFDSEIKLTYTFHKDQKSLYLCDSESSDRIGLNTYL